MYDFDPIVSPYNGHMLRNLSKYYLLICCKQGNSTHFCHFLATAFVADVLAGSNPSVMGPKMKGPHSWEPIKSVVGDEGCPRAAVAARFRFGPAALACCAGKRLRVSSAPHPGGFESLCTGPKKERPPSLGAFSIKWWAMRDSNPQPCACKAPALTVAPIARAERV